MSKQNVIIIGGGLGGICAAVKLSKTSQATINIIEPKAYVEVPWASVRGMFDADMAERITIPMSEILSKYPSLKHVRSRVKAMSKTTVTLSTGEEMEFDVCLIATGAHKPFVALEPWDTPEIDADEEKSLSTRRSTMTDNGDKLTSAESVLIIGGGLIGTELAGDLAAYAQLKGGHLPAITVVHSGSNLAEAEFSQSGSKRLKAKLEKYGVKVVLNDRAMEQDGKWTLRSSGNEVDAAQVIRCFGVHAMNEFMQDGEMDGCLDDKGWIKVDDSFRVQGGDGQIFAVGDCCDALRKAGVSVFENKGVIAKNMATTLVGLANKESLEGLKLKSKVHPPNVFVVTIGPKDGIAQTPIGATGVMLPWIKNKTMFLFKARSEMGL